MTTKIIYINPTIHSHHNPATQRDRLHTTNNFNFTKKETTQKETPKNGGPTMTNSPMNTPVNTKAMAKVTHFKRRNCNPVTPLEMATIHSNKILVKRRASTSALGMLMALGHIPKAYGQTISRYEILRSHSLSDGPNKPRCLLMGKERVRQKYTPIYVRDVDIQRAEKIQKAWRDSVYILESYGCKDILDNLLRMEEASNGHAMLSMDEIYGLRGALRDLTRYYARRIAA
jgi:hypothetical protein